MTHKGGELISTMEKKKGGRGGKKRKKLHKFLETFQMWSSVMYPEWCQDMLKYIYP